MVYTLLFSDLWVSLFHLYLHLEAQSAFYHLLDTINGLLAHPVIIKILGRIEHLHVSFDLVLTRTLSRRKECPRLGVVVCRDGRQLNESSAR